MDLIYWGLVIFAIGVGIKAYHDDQLLKSNPEAWKLKKETEATNREFRRQLVKNASVNGYGFVRKLFGK